jgi:hypothetical protein
MEVSSFYQDHKEVTLTLNGNDRIRRHKLGLLNLAQELGTVSRVCEVMGPRATRRTAIDRAGLAGPRCLPATVIRSRGTARIRVGVELGVSSCARSSSSRRDSNIGQQHIPVGAEAGLPAEQALVSKQPLKITVDASLGWWIFATLLVAIHPHTWAISPVLGVTARL